MIESVASDYVLARSRGEIERLASQARLWDPALRGLLGRSDLRGARTVDIGCGPNGALPALADAVGPAGTVVGTDIDTASLAAARDLADARGLPNVELVIDNVFASALPSASFDLVHARFQLAPLGRAEEQVEVFRRLTAPGGVVVLEEPDSASWRFNPPAPSAERLIDLVVDSFRSQGSDFDAGRRLPQLLVAAGLDTDLDAHVIALPPGHPYLQLPLQLADALTSKLEATVGRDELALLQCDAALELEDPTRWGTTFTLVQTWGRLPR